MQPKSFVILWVFLYPALVLADTVSGLGGIASNLMDPIGVLGDFINTMAIAIGGSFVFASIIKYLQYRQNPLAVPISTVVWLLILGIMLIFLPLAYRLAYEVPPTVIVKVS